MPGGGFTWGSGYRRRQRAVTMCAAIVLPIHWAVGGAGWGDEKISKYAPTHELKLSRGPSVNDFCLSRCSTGVLVERVSYAPLP